MKGTFFGDKDIEVAPDVWERGPSWKMGRVWHPETIEFFHRQMVELDSPVVVDAGACVGNYSMAAKFHPNAVVYAFEPHPQTYGLLAEQIRLNGMEGRIIPTQCALWHKDGQQTLVTRPKRRHWGSATLGKPPQHHKWDSVAVEARRLDSFDWPNGIQLMKIDVEGAEWFVLRGGRKVIKQYKPGIFLEYVSAHTKKYFGYERHEVKRHLRSWGYKRFDKIGGIDIWATA